MRYRYNLLLLLLLLLCKAIWRIVRTSEKILATPLVCQSSPDFHNFCQCVENKIVISFIAANKSFHG